MTIETPAKSENLRGVYGIVPRLRASGFLGRRRKRDFNKKYLGNAIVDDSANLEWPVTLTGCKIEKKVNIGRYSYAASGTVVVSGTKIGRYCAIARGVEISPPEHPTDWLSIHGFQYNFAHFGEIESYKHHSRVKRQSPPAAVIGNDVWIAAKAIIRRGVTIGDGAIIGAGAFVNKDVEPYAIVGGSPARVIRKRFSDDIIEKLLALQWWDLHPWEMDNVDFDQIEKAIEQIAEIKSNLKK